MAAIPVHCPHCGAIFRSRGLSILGSTAFAKSSVQRITLGGNREPCISCGKMANIVDGVFDTSGDVLKLLKGPKLTSDVLRNFSKLLNLAHQNTITPDELQDQAEKLDPSLGKAVAEIRKKPASSPLVFFLLFTALNTCDFNLEATVNLNQLLDQAFSTIEATNPPKSLPEHDGENAAGNKEKGDANPPGGGGPKHQ